MINVLFGGNYKVFDGLLLALLSMAKHTKESLNIYVLTADVTELNPEYKPITEENIKQIEQILQAKNPENKITLIKLGNEFNDWIKSSKNKLNSYTPFAFLRLFAQNIDALPDKIIYLDCDVMLKGDIKELFNIDISNYEMGVVKDRYGRFFISPTYFNSGVLLLNLNRIRQTNLFERVKEMCLTKKMKMPDQTALNHLCEKVLYLPRRFNEQGDLKKNTVVQHFSMRFNIFPYLHGINIKPWHVDRVHKERKNFAYDDIYEEYFDIKGEPDKKAKLKTKKR